MKWGHSSRQRLPNCGYPIQHQLAFLFSLGGRQLGDTFAGALATDNHNDSNRHGKNVGRRAVSEFSQAFWCKVTCGARCSGALHISFRTGNNRHVKIRDADRLACLVQKQQIVRLDVAMDQLAFSEEVVQRIKELSGNSCQPSRRILFSAEKPTCSTNVTTKSFRHHNVVEFRVFKNMHVSQQRIMGAIQQRLHHAALLWLYINLF
mmetsp:Transcript_56337/g.123420  ORF Transcript_56337/g.123420 Transcript_56337/m.123420 type:complete len:206 (+) Transcript_56337:260-877(+)